jgi:hypothetical protein
MQQPPQSGKAKYRRYVGRNDARGSFFGIFNERVEVASLMNISAPHAAAAAPSI